MAVILEFLNLIVPIEVIKAKYPGGWKQCLKDHEQHIGSTVWYDDYIFRDGAMSGNDIQMLVDEWSKMGFEPTVDINGEIVWKDLCVIGELGGICNHTCNWLIYEPRMRTVYLNGTDPDNLIRMARPKKVYIPNPNERRRINYLAPDWKDGIPEKLKRYRATIIVELDGSILLVETRAGLVLLPGGGVNRGETSIAAAARELNEETGLEANLLFKLFNLESKTTYHNVFYAMALESTAVAKDDAVRLHYLNELPSKSKLNMSSATIEIIERFYKMDQVNVRELARKTLLFGQI